MLRRSAGQAQGNIQHTYQKRYRVVSKRILRSSLGDQPAREARLLMRGQHLMN